jgi:FkbM family methyltransferase
LARYNAAVSLAGRAVRAPLRLIPAGAVLPILKGPLRGSRWVAGSATHGCWLGTYEQSTQATLTELIHPGMTVFDVGANVGFFTLLASRLVGPAGRVYAFEPLPRNIAYLRHHLALNGVEARVEVVPAAVSDRHGAGLFAAGANPLMGRLSDAGDIVTTVRLDDFPVPHVVKMDIEGGEVAALDGAPNMLAAEPSLFLSTHGAGAHEACMTRLERAGYALQVLASSSPGHRDIVATAERRGVV